MSALLRLLPPPSSSLLLRPSSVGPQLQARDRSSPPDPNSKLRIRMFPTGPQLQARDRTVPCRTRTASSGSEPSLPDSTASERSLPDPNSKLRTRMFLQLFHISFVFVFCFHVFHVCSCRSIVFISFPFFSPPAR